MTAATQHADKFLLDCVRLLFNKIDKNDLEKQLLSTDWETVTGQAVKHAFAGTLYSMNQQQLLPGQTPDASVCQWKQAITQQAFLQMAYQAEGAQLLSGLAEQGLPVVLLKGFAYMQELYGDSATRSVSDMDILILKEDFVAVKQFLLENGFELYISEFYLERAAEFEQFQADQNYEATFIKKAFGTQLSLDVHWNMGSGWPGYEHLGIFALDRIPWQELTESFSFNGIQTRRLTPTAHFFHLMSHFALHHRFSGLKWMQELCLFLSVLGDKIDWKWINHYAEVTGCRKVVGSTLRIVSGILGDDHPAAARWRAFWPDFLPGEYPLFCRRLFKTESQLMGAMCLLLLIARPFDKARLIGYLLFDPQGIPQLRLSSSASSLPRRLVQPFYLIGVVAAGVYRRTAGKREQ